MMTKKKLFVLWVAVMLILLLLNYILWLDINQIRKNKIQKNSIYSCIEGIRVKELRSAGGLIGYVTLKEKCKPSDPVIEIDYD